jgi:hypothetical protein
MAQSRRIGVSVVIRVALAALVAAWVAAPSAGAASRCEPVSGTLTSTANFSNFTTSGTISGALNGTTFFRGDASSLAPVTGTSSPTLNTTDHYTGDLTITTRQGVLVTRSVGVFEFAPNGLGTQFDHVLGEQSTGRFAGATGQLYFNFVANSTVSGFSSTYTGQICR